jgi:hypothetical protein
MPESVVPESAEMEFVSGQLPLPQKIACDRHLWLQGWPIRMRLQHIGGGEKAWEPLRVQYWPVLIFAGLLVHVFSGAPRLLRPAN